ncbi:MAG TPA: hypothetical protein VKQ52_04235 [Puia sp.]|nr:hypothetical protein [Puia sp.]
MKKVLGFIALMAITNLFQTINAQSKLDFKFCNNTGNTLYSIFVSEHDARTWGKDILKEDVLGNGDCVDVTFPDYGDRTCHWDIKVTYSVDDAQAWTINFVNLCEIRKLTLYRSERDGSVMYKTE